MALLIPKFDGTEELCSGTLYATRSVLTAAHCLVDAAAVFAYYGNDFNDDIVQLGDDPSTWTKWAMAVDWNQHPAWDPATLNADIAVVHIDRNPPFSPLPVSTRTLSNGDVGDRVEIVGFGGTSSPDNASATDAFVKRKGTSVYQGSPPRSPLPPNPHPGLGIKSIREQLMQLSGTAPNANACFGDSGGPALVWKDGRQAIAGVASWTGDFCEKFSYYVRVSEFGSFLNAQALRR